MLQQVEYRGPNSIYALEEILEIQRPNRVFLITGKSSYQQCGAKQSIDRILKNITFDRFSDLTSNPQFDEVLQASESFREKECDFIIAVGGGSVIDMGKMVNTRAASKVPMVAIPTTAGTGSEATSFATCYKGNIKTSIKGFLPDFVILDPIFAFNLPKNIAAVTGMDALCQAIESFWSIKSTEESKKFAEESARLSWENLEAAVNAPNPENRAIMLEAANLSGKAINISETTACHAISYPFTSQYKIPHGHAVALTLSDMLVYNYEVDRSNCSDARGADYVRSNIEYLCSCLPKVGDPYAARDKFRHLMKSIGLKSKISFNQSFLTKHINLERLNNNPRKITESNLKTILDSIQL